MKKIIKTNKLALHFFTYFSKLPIPLPMVLVLDFLQNLPVIMVAQLADRTRFDGCGQCAARFAAVHARPAEAAIFRYFEKFAVILCHVHRFQKIERQRFDARRVDDPPAKIELVHLGEGRRVLPKSMKRGKSTPLPE